MRTTNTVPSHTSGSLPGEGKKAPLISEKIQEVKRAALKPLSGREWLFFLGDAWNQTTTLRKTDCELQFGVAHPVTQEQFVELQTLTQLAGNITFRGISVAETENSSPAHSLDLVPEPGRLPAGWVNDYQTSLNDAIRDEQERAVLSVPPQLGDKQQLTMLLIDFVLSARTSKLVIELPGSRNAKGLTELQMGQIAGTMKACNADGIRIECHHGQHQTVLTSRGVELPNGMTLVPGERIRTARDIFNS
jgi:hypothetical protein